DVLNFRIAGEISGDDQVETEIVLVDDDLATDTADGGGPGRRGTAATVIVEKVCGAAAEEGQDLAAVAEVGRRAAASARTMSLALTAGTHPGDEKPQFALGDDEVELGVGIHGERAAQRVPFTSADGLTDLLLDPLLKDLELHRGDEVLAIVNGLGGTYPLELNLVARALHHRLAEAGIAIQRSLVGSYVTSLDMHGVSITLMPLTDEFRRLWDAPVRTPALTW
ncbi:MAG TPA: dihydroxyacetone kinase subunit DhaK, partial [Candidatus Brachybacterium merdigallinarum]|nr:dihydroxyacetone kinase subunit DhaK [Candidatus Brachybacterium merdigallinarum]